MKSKKFIPVVLALVGAAAVLGGCDGKDNTEQYDALNAMLDLHYSQIVLTVKNTFDEETALTSEYTMNFTDGGMTVSYSVERFAEASLSAASQKTTLEGEATIAGGKITYTKGDEVSLDAVKSGIGFAFDGEYFENVELTGIYLKADVKNPSAFMRSTLSCSEMKVSATFLEVFYDIQITYRAETGNKVEYLFTFTI
ncbi:MAG: hypothetical protein K2N74_03450 [Clostridiales bacterium]|nr:hypothetical protein [Clostridiales bacterium]